MLRFSNLHVVPTVTLEKQEETNPDTIKSVDWFLMICCHTVRHSTFQLAKSHGWLPTQ